MKTMLTFILKTDLDNINETHQWFRAQYYGPLGGPFVIHDRYAPDSVALNISPLRTLQLYRMRAAFKVWNSRLVNGHLFMILDGLCFLVLLFVTPELISWILIWWCLYYYYYYLSLKEYFFKCRVQLKKLLEHFTEVKQLMTMSHVYVIN